MYVREFVINFGIDDRITKAYHYFFSERSLTDNLIGVPKKPNASRNLFSI